MWNCPDFSPFKKNSLEKSSALNKNLFLPFCSKFDGDYEIIKSQANSSSIYGDITLFATHDEILQNFGAFLGFPRSRASSDFRKFDQKLRFGVPISLHHLVFKNMC